MGIVQKNLIPEHQTGIPSINVDLTETLRKIFEEHIDNFQEIKSNENYKERDTRDIINHLINTEIIPKMGTELVKYVRQNDPQISEMFKKAEKCQTVEALKKECTEKYEAFSSKFDVFARDLFSAMKKQKLFEPCFAKYRDLYEILSEDEIKEPYKTLFEIYSDKVKPRVYINQYKELLPEILRTIEMYDCKLDVISSYYDPSIQYKLIIPNKRNGTFSEIFRRFYSAGYSADDRLLGETRNSKEKYVNDFKNNFIHVILRKNLNNFTNISLDCNPPISFLFATNDIEKWFAHIDRINNNAIQIGFLKDISKLIDLMEEELKINLRKINKYLISNNYIHDVIFELKDMKCVQNITAVTIPEMYEEKIKYDELTFTEQIISDYILLTECIRVIISKFSVLYSLHKVFDDIIENAKNEQPEYFTISVSNRTFLIVNNGNYSRFDLISIIDLVTKDFNKYTYKTVDSFIEKMTKDYQLKLVSEIFSSDTIQNFNTEISELE